MDVYILNNLENIEKIIGRNNRFADSINSGFPVHRLQLPLLWWKHFSSENGIDFGSNRGRNFFGSKSWLKKLCFIVVENKGELYGMAPLFISEVFLRGVKEPVKILSFCADSSLIFYHDFLINPRHRKETISGIFHYIKGLLEAEKYLLFLGHIPEKSLNIKYYKDQINLMIDSGWGGGETTNCWRGGVYPWNIKKLCSILQSLLKELSEKDFKLKSEINKIIEGLNSQTSTLMLFAGTRKDIESKIENIFHACRKRPGLEKHLNGITNILSTNPIVYPYLDLPEDANSFFSSLSSSKRYFYRRYMKKFIAAGGEFENIAPADISISDIKEYLALHSMRWQDESAAVNKQTITFHEKLSLSMANSGYFRLFFAKYNERRIAVLSCFDIADRREFYYSGRTVSDNKLRAGKLLVLYSILDAIEKEFKSFDFGYGGDEYKFDFTKEYRILKSFFLTKDKKLPDLNKLFPMYEQIII